MQALLAARYVRAKRVVSEIHPIRVMSTMTHLARKIIPLTPKKSENNVMLYTCHSMVKYYFRTIKDEALKEIPDLRTGAWVHAVEPSEKELSELFKTLSLDEDIIEDAQDFFEVITRVEIFALSKQRQAQIKLYTIDAAVGAGEEFTKRPFGFVEVARIHGALGIGEITIHVGGGGGLQPAAILREA